MRRIMTHEEIAARTRVPLNTLRYWRGTGDGPRTFKVGHRVVAYEDDVEAWLEAQYRAGETA